MRIFHLLNNWKWTERSEPTVELALSEKRLGADITFICGRSPKESENDVAYNARLKGLDKIIELEMPKHFNLKSIFHDTQKLRKLIKELQPDVINCHMQNAHLTAALAVGKDHLPLIIRSSYHPEGPGTGFRNRFLYTYRTSGTIVIGEKARHNAIKRFHFSANKVKVAAPGIDLGRFSPKRALSDEEINFGLDHSSFVMGIVSRIREARRLDIALDTLHILAARYPQLRFLIVGRGSQGAVENVIMKPLQKMGLENRVCLAGYCRHNRLVAAYRAMNALIYPIPGTDKTCRTVREAMAAGVPVIAPSTGFLPELISNGNNGYLIDMCKDTLADIISSMIENPHTVGKLSERALKTAQNKFSTATRAEKTLEFYDLLTSKNDGLIKSPKANDTVKGSVTRNTKP
jgi:glycosyltransferase involved in cell wall biosynthesis